MESKGGPAHFRIRLAFRETAFRVPLLDDQGLVRGHSRKVDARVGLAVTRKVVLADPVRVMNGEGDQLVGVHRDRIAAGERFTLHRGNGSPHVDESKATFAVQCLLHEVLIQEGQGNLEHIIKAFSCSESDSSEVWDSRTLLTSIAATARSAGTAA